MEPVQLTIIIPVKNEEKNIRELVLRIHAALTASKITYAVIAVNDRSTDKTADILAELSQTFPVRIHNKRGKPGKSYSILEGSHLAQSSLIAVIDADLQYAPEALPRMYAEAKKHGVVVANRKTYKSSNLRRLLSRANKYIFGRLLHGLHVDVQSGLKIFRKDILEHVDLSTVRAWSLDIPLLYTARELGYSIGSVDIEFELRTNGNSHVRLLSTAFEIAQSSMALRLKKKQIYQLPPHSEGSMKGAGVAHNRRRYITHTTLSHRVSALVTFTFWQHVAMIAMMTIAAAGLVINPHSSVVAAIAVLSILYFIDVLFNLFLIGRSLHTPPEIEVSRGELDTISDSRLPVYSILCPLYKEAHVLPQFLKSIEALDWPKAKLDVLLLLEEDDQETIEAASRMKLPEYVRVLVVPHSQPKTKPKACNYGLAHARGEYIVIFDAEDNPDPLQLKKAYMAFGKVASTVVCLQAKLNYYNPHQNLLTRLFTAEYSLWFDVVLPGLQTMETSIPLGGTSNHFRTSALRDIKGWDAFNVTEDCDLGVRLFKEGYRTAIINSTTLEEANSRPMNWLRQRSRWIKGYMQTYLVHMRDPFKFVQLHGIHALLFQLNVGGKIISMFINPLMWAITIIYFAFRPIVGTFIESFFPGPILYLGVFCLVFGNFLSVYYYMIAVAKNQQWSLVKFVFLVPFYWLAMSIAAWIALWELFTSPFYWSKTVHGFHIKPVKPLSQVVANASVTEKNHGILPNFQKQWSGITYGGALIAASFTGHFINFLGVTYLARSPHVSFEQLGTISLVGSFLALMDIPVGAFRRTLTHRISYLFGKFGHGGREVWQYYIKRSIIVAIFAMVAWDLAAPVISGFFQSKSVIPVILFGPVWVLAMIAAVNNAYLSASQKFQFLAIVLMAETISKLAFTYVFVQSGYIDYVYLALPLSITMSMLVAAKLMSYIAEDKKLENQKEVGYFPAKFFSTSLMLRISSVLFLTMDLVLAKHYLSPALAGEYALLSSIGKMVYLFGTQFIQFINPVISRMEGAKLNSRHVFGKLFGLTVIVSTVGFVTLGVLGARTVPFLMGPKTSSILQYVLPYTFVMTVLAMTDAIVSYHQIRKNYFFPTVSLLAGIAQVVGIVLFHANIEAIVNIMMLTTLGYFLFIVISHLSYDMFSAVAKNLKDLFGLVENIAIPAPIPQKMRILIFNWRDMKHIWAGGAEVYVHELAKHWVADGHKVTVFCGNDGTADRNQMIDGVQIVRRGGFYTVYIWAFLYYILRFKGSFDVVIDSENGVPFFSKLYAGVPVFLLIYHVHQEVFQKHLSFPYSYIAMAVEAKLLPLVYRNTKVITISRSTEMEIIRTGIAKKENIEIVTPGVSITRPKNVSKTSYPSFLYLGRLKPYKNVDVALRAFASIRKRHLTAKFTIAGFGESQPYLIQLAKDLGIAKSVIFSGKVTEEEKAVLLTRNMVVIQPSSIEGWGITVMEANACGTPVIASNVPGLRDSVIDGVTGLLVQPNNVLSLASAMEKMIANTQMRHSLATKAFQLAKQYRWEDKAILYKSIIDIEFQRHYNFVPKNRLVTAKY